MMKAFQHTDKFWYLIFLMYSPAYLLYVFPLIKFASGQSHANENVTWPSESGGTVTEAAMAAPMDDPGSEVTDVSIELRRSKDPCYYNIRIDIILCSNVIKEAWRT